MWGSQEKIHGQTFNECYVMLNIAGRTQQVPAYAWTEGGYAIYNAQGQYEKAHGVAGWTVIDLSLRQMVRTYMGTPEEAVKAMLLVAQNTKDGFTDHVIEELALATAPLPKRWAECVTLLDRCLGL